jgi:hypothetical protein
MPLQVYFFVSIAFSLIAWGIVAARYIWPELRHRERAEALRPASLRRSRSRLRAASMSSQPSFASPLPCFRPLFTCCPVRMQMAEAVCRKTSWSPLCPWSCRAW